MSGLVILSVVDLLTWLFSSSCSIVCSPSLVYSIVASLCLLPLFGLLMFPSAGVHPVDQLFSLYQDVCPLEDFVEQFLELSHHMPLNDGMLKVCFWSGLDNPISQLMPMEEASCALT